MKQLPRQGGDPGSAEGAAAAGREQAESMAGALEGAQLGDAVESGKKASQSLGEAKRAGDQNKGFFPEERAGREASRARETIERASHSRRVSAAGVVGVLLVLRGMSLGIPYLSPDLAAGVCCDHAPPAGL